MEKQTYFVTGEALKVKRRMFLKGRCAEGQYFGMVNVTEWLQKQRLLDRPSDIEAWTRIIHRNADMEGSDVGKEPLLKLLNCFGLRLGEANSTKDECLPIVNFRNIHDCVRGVFGNSSKSFVTDSAILFLSPDNTYVMRFEGNKNGGTYISNILRSDVLMSALLSWKHRTEFHQPITGRDFLCTWLSKRIQHVLVEAGKEFDEAVAVSVDGTKIVTADKVVFSRPEGPSLMYGKDLFVKNKIVLLSDFLGYRKYTAASDVPRFRRRFIKSSLEHWQQYFTAVFIPDNVFEKWLWCHIGHDDFPEGGTPLNL